MSLKGVPQMRAVLRQLAVMYPNKVASALFVEGSIEMTESKKRVPVDKGILRDSGMVSPPEFKGNTTSVTLSYGGAAEDYAIIVHEDLDAFHDDGQAKYLESVLNESRPYMAGRIVQRIKF